MLRRACLLVVPAALGWAHEPITTKLTWTQEISRIVYRRCVSCHREGGRAPMSLVTYDEARPWAKAIRDEVLGRRMPPWGAMKGFGKFRDDPSLSDVEITWLVEWVEGGAPKGEDLFLPPAPPAPPDPGPQPRAKPLAVRNSLTLTQPVIAIGIEPLELAEGDSLRVVAQQPDGSIEPLLWVPRYRREQHRAYYFDKPVKLPRGAVVRAGPAASLLTATASPAR